MGRLTSVDRHPLPGGRRRGRGDGVTTQALTFKSYRSHRGQSSGSGGIKRSREAQPLKNVNSVGGMSAIGTKRTFRGGLTMSALGGKADLTVSGGDVRV